MIDDQVQADYERARNKALLNDMISAVSRRDNRLLPFHEFRSRISPEGESYRGMQEVPISRIVGTEPLCCVRPIAQHAIVAFAFA